MPVYEYFCPHCYRELEVLRPIQSAADYSDCPNCGGKAWRLLSGFGSRTGSYLQPSGEPLRADHGWQVSTSEIAGVVANISLSIKSPADQEQVSSAVEMSWLLESQPNGSNIWFIQDWGIASMLRYIREDLDGEVARGDARPVESPTDPVSVMDQRIEYPNLGPWPEERTAELTSADEPVIRPTDVPMVAFAELWAGDQSGEPAIVTKRGHKAKREPSRQWAPKSYFGWFVLILVSISAIVVLLVWVLAVAA